MIESRIYSIKKIKRKCSISASRDKIVTVVLSCSRSIEREGFR